MISCRALPAGSISLFPINSPISLFPIGFALFVFFFRQCTHVSLCAHSGGRFCLQKKQKKQNKTKKSALPYRFLHFSKISKTKQTRKRASAISDNINITNTLQKKTTVKKKGVLLEKRCRGRKVEVARGLTGSRGCG